VQREAVQTKTRAATNDGDSQCVKTFALTSMEVLCCTFCGELRPAMAFKAKQRRAAKDRTSAVRPAVLRCTECVKAAINEQLYQVLVAVVDMLEHEQGPLLLGEVIFRLRRSKEQKLPPSTILHAVRTHLGGHVSVTNVSRNKFDVQTLKLESARGARIELDLMRAKYEPCVVAPTAAALGALQEGGATSAQGSPSEASFFTERWLPAGFASFGIDDNETDGALNEGIASSELVVAPREVAGTQPESGGARLPAFFIPSGGLGADCLELELEAREKQVGAGHGKSTALYNWEGW